MLLEEIVDHRKNDKAVKNGRCMDPYEVGDSMKEALEKETNNATALNLPRMVKYGQATHEITSDRKCRLVANGHCVNEQPKEKNYSSVPSRETVRLFFILAATNDCDVMAAD